jgi:hypothetical protein
MRVQALHHCRIDLITEQFAVIGVNAWICLSTHMAGLSVSVLLFY